MGVGTQVGALDWNAGGKACRTCTEGSKGMTQGIGEGMSKYFDGMNGPRGSTGAGAIVGSDGTGQYYLGAAGNAEIYSTASGAQNNPWHTTKEEWWCCIFHDAYLEDLKLQAISNTHALNVDWTPGCTDPNATVITGWGAAQSGSNVDIALNPWWNNYNPSANIDDGTCCYYSTGVCNGISGGGGGNTN